MNFFQDIKCERFSKEGIINTPTYKVGMKVKVIKDVKKNINIETINLNGMIGIIVSVSSDYVVDIEGREFCLQESDIKFISQPIEYKKQYYELEYSNLEGVLVPNIGCS